MKQIDISTKANPNKFTTFMTAIITNEEDNPTKAVVSIKARAKKLLKEAIK